MNNLVKIALVAVGGYLLINWLKKETNKKGFLAKFRDLLAKGKINEEDVEVIVQDPTTGEEKVVSAFGESVSGDGADVTEQRIADFADNSQSNQLVVKVVSPTGQVIDSSVIDRLGGDTGSGQRVYGQYCYDGLGNLLGTVGLGQECPANTAKSNFGWI